ncbi:site-specific DNA-methyltransferase [Novosphingobium sp.]|uniref:site-specific DNA-methyltransferase n=1 Tax=Novosphingobium sp. TaxID=1874826 RepID=UPI002FE18C3B
MSEEIHETPSTTPNFQTELAAQLAELMPEVIADGKVDVEKLKELLDGDAADTSERFGLFWPGKKRALRAAQEPTTATLRPDFENSKDWDTTKNVFIEGDNLEVLKILQKHYHAKIKMIYIDPPYNTGKDFVYPDNYKEGLDTYLEWTRQVNEEGKKLSTNADTDGRYHSNWLNMMYPRLKLARNLLTEDGVVFISIDDAEVAHLRKIADEVFGEANFVANVVWQKKYTRANDARWFSDNHDHVLCYARKKAGMSLNLLPREASQLKAYSNPDGHHKGPWKATPLHAKSGSNTGGYTFANGVTWTPPAGTYRRFNDESMKRMEEGNEIWFGSDGRQTPSRKSFLSEVKVGVTPVTIWGYEEVGHNHEANSEIKALGLGGLFDNPKPTRLIRRMVALATGPNDLVLDFFAGSGTTAQAVLAANAEDGGNRRFIVAQLPEPTPEKSEARQKGYSTISAIARCRIDEAGQAVSAELEETLNDRSEPLDVGFRAYTLADTSFSKWKLSSDVDRTELEQHLVDLRESSSADDASADDLLSEILLKQGYSLTEQIAPVEVVGLDLRSVGDGIVLAYLNEHVKPTLEQLRAVADEDPARLIVLEDAFQGDDQLKTNLAQLCKSKGIELWTA